MTGFSLELIKLPDDTLKKASRASLGRTGRLSLPVSRFQINSHREQVGAEEADCGSIAAAAGK
jgi:hypothetical protein